MDKEDIFYIKVVAVILIFSAVMIVLSILATNVQTTTIISDECIHFENEVNSLFGEDSRTSDVYCLTPVP